MCALWRQIRPIWRVLVPCSERQEFKYAVLYSSLAPRRSCNLCANELFRLGRCCLPVGVAWHRYSTISMNFNARAHIAANQSVNHLPLSRIMIMAWLFKCSMLIRLLQQQTEPKLRSIRIYSQPAEVSSTQAWQHIHFFSQALVRFAF